MNICMKFSLLLVLVGASTLSVPAFAVDSGKCSSMLNEGLYKKYKWRGMGESNSKAITAETKSSNIVSASSKMTTEGSTASLDPKYSSNVSTSQTQASSSWGECSLFALQERKEQRDLYVEQNLDQIKKDISSGQGNHLQTLAWFSLCEDSAQAKFNQAMQEHMSDFLVTDSKELNKNIDGVIKGNAELSGQCYVLSSK